MLAVAFLATGCAPHRRGRLPADDLPVPTERPPLVEGHRPAETPSTAWTEIDPSAPPAERVAAMADAFIGTPYVWGGSTPSGFDCSGLVQFVYKEVGVGLPRRAVDQSRSGRAASLRDLELGDLVFFRIDRDIISHVGIHVGEGEFVHAPGTGKTVRRDSLDDDWWRRRVKAVRRIITR